MSAGAVYLDLPATLLSQNVDENKIIKVSPCPPPPLLYPDTKLIEQAADLLMRAKRPLIIIGKGECMRLNRKYLLIPFALFFYLLNFFT
jgi:thiamine pyrophosphate-dependent acetolactate synthase large subunit-like protein